MSYHVSWLLCFFPLSIFCLHQQDNWPFKGHHSPSFNTTLSDEMYNTQQQIVHTRIPRSPNPDADSRRRNHQFNRHQNQRRQQQYHRPVIVTPSPDVTVYSAADTGIEKRFFSPKKRNVKSKKTTRSPTPLYNPPTYDPSSKPAPLTLGPEGHSVPSPPALYYDFKPTVGPYTSETVHTSSVDHVPGPPYTEYVYEKTTAWPASYSVTTSPHTIPDPGATYYKPLPPSQNILSDHYSTGGGREPESIYREETTHFQPGTVVHRGAKQLVRRI